MKLNIPMSIRITIASLFFLMAMFSFACNPRYGFIESEHHLSKESRLPKWFVAPPNYSRDDLTITITMYLSFNFSSEFTARIIVRGPAPEHKVLMDKSGVKIVHPITEQRGNDKYPLYSIVRIDGIEEVFEQRRPEPFFYISDDPEITAVINQEKTNKR